MDPNHHQIWTPSCIHLLLKPASFLQLESENVMMEAHRHTSDWEFMLFSAQVTHLQLLNFSAWNLQQHLPVVDSVTYKVQFHVPKFYLNTANWFFDTFLSKTGQHIRGSPTYYCPHESLTDGEDEDLPEFHPSTYSLYNMPICNHQEYTFQSLKTEELGQKNNYSKKTEINSFPAILKLMILCVPELFLLDIMHLLYQGIISHIFMLLFAGNFWKEGSFFNYSDHGKIFCQI